MLHSKFYILTSSLGIALSLFILPAVVSAQDITTGLVGHWKFDETSGTTATDSSGNNNAGTLTNGPVWTTGKIGGAVSFDGVDDYVRIPASTGLNNMTTISAGGWFLLKAVQNNYGFLGCINGENATGQGFLSVDNAGTETIKSDIQIGGTIDTRQPATTLGTNQWHHYMYVYDGSSETLYLDGSVLATFAKTGTLWSNTECGLLIGAAYEIGTTPGLPINGQIDEVRVYSRALTASDIQALHALGSGTPPPSDTQAPTVSLTAPTSGSTASGLSVTVSANALDNVGVVGVQFLLDGANLNSEDTTSPYSISWNTTTATNGLHTLTARARDAAGNSTTSSGVTVTVNNVAPPADTQAPSTPTNLSAIAVSSSQINLSWTASTDNMGVTGYRVERCQGSSCTNFAQIATPSGTSYSDTGLTTNTTYRYQVRASDATGNVSNYSSMANAATQSAGTSPLAQLAASMQPGTWAVLSTNGFNQQYLLQPTPSGQDFVTNYADSAAWDPITKQFLFLGAGHFSVWKFLMYQDSSNTWGSGPLPIVCMSTTSGCIGHGYDHNIINPATGDLFHRPYYSREVYKFNTTNGQWSLLTTMPTNVIPSISNANALAYFPEMGKVDCFV